MTQVVTAMGCAATESRWRSSAHSRPGFEGWWGGRALQARIAAVASCRWVYRARAPRWLGSEVLVSL